MNKKELEPRNIYFFLNSIAAAVEYTSKTDPFRWMKGGKKRIQNGVQNGVQNGKEGLEDFFLKKPEKGVGKWKAEKPKTFWNFFPFFSFFFGRKKSLFAVVDKWRGERVPERFAWVFGELHRVLPSFTEFFFWETSDGLFPFLEEALEGFRWTEKGFTEFCGSCHRFTWFYRVFENLMDYT